MEYFIMAVVEFKATHKCLYEKDGGVFQYVDERTEKKVINFEVGKETFLTELNSVEKIRQRIKSEFVSQNIETTIFIGQPMEFFQEKKQGFIKRKEMTYLKYDIDTSTIVPITYLILIKDSYYGDTRKSYLEDTGAQEFLKEVNNGKKTYRFFGFTRIRDLIGRLF